MMLPNLGSAENWRSGDSLSSTNAVRGHSQNWPDRWHYCKQACSVNNVMHILCNKYMHQELPNQHDANES